VDRHKAILKLVWAFGKWIVPIAAAGGAGWWGLTKLDWEVLGYRVQVNKAPPATGWDGQLKEEQQAGKKKP
jgi:hypothetical protein